MFFVFGADSFYYLGHRVCLCLLQITYLESLEYLFIMYIFIRLCPIFQVSNVSGENLELLKIFLNLLTTRMEYHENEPAEFQIDDTYSVPVFFLIYVFFLSTYPLFLRAWALLFPEQRLKV